jgi:aminoglycoside phosphotransferase
MRWLRERGLPVPAVVDYRRIDLTEYLVTEAGIGMPASDNHWHLAPGAVATALGDGLARLHATDVSVCPFDRRVRTQLNEARARIAAGLVREDDFDPPRLGRTAASLFDELVGMIPVREELVLVHGDFCLPNVLLSHANDGLRITGLVDCARAGVGDRYQDLALAMRSLTFNLGPETLAPFLAAYGDPSLDSNAIEFFTILDELF